MAATRMPQMRQAPPSIPSARGTAMSYPMSRNNAVASGTVAPRIQGPSKFLQPKGNGQSTVNIYVTDTDIAGITNLMEMHEHGAVFVVNMERPDFADKHVALSLQQLNVFLQEVDATARAVYKSQYNETSLDKLTATWVRRQARRNPKMEILKFLCVETMIEVIQFLGVQFGNRYVHPRAGPGIAVIVEGWGDMRNTCINGCKEQDELWWVMRRRSPRAPLSIVMEATSDNAGITPGMRQYVDLAGQTSWGAAIKIGMVLDKPKPDLLTQYSRELASGLVGTTAESHNAERNAPTFRVLLSNCGTGMFRV